MDDRLIESLQQSPVFSSVNKQGLKRIASLFDVMELGENETLFLRGDDPDFMYLVISGVLTNYLVNKQGDTIVIGQVKPGHTVGESGVLSGEPRMLSVKAEHACVLGRLSAQRFKSLCLGYPSILQEIIAIIIKRSQQTINFIADEYSLHWHIIINTCEQDAFERFRERIKRTAQGSPDVLLVDAHDMERLDMVVGEQQKEHSHVIVLIQSPAQARTFLRRIQNSKLYVLANTTEADSFDEALPVLRDIINQYRFPACLILMHSDNTRDIHGTETWLQKISVTSHHHIKINQDKDYQRLLRFMNGSATVLVLGGGGAKGWVHAGVIKALNEKGIEIDALGGTSAGSMVAACYLTSPCYDDILTRVRSVTQAYYKAIKARNLTWPLLSLYDPDLCTGQKIISTPRAVIRCSRMPSRDQLNSGYFALH